MAYHLCSTVVVLSGGFMRRFILALAVFTAGCATHPISIQQAAAVPSNRILAPQWLQPAQYTGSLVIKRDAGFMGSACVVRVFIDSAIMSSARHRRTRSAAAAHRKPQSSSFPNGKRSCGSRAGRAEICIFSRAPSDRSLSISRFSGRCAERPLPTPKGSRFPVI